MSATATEDKTVIDSGISNRTAVAAMLVEEHDQMQKKIIEFMQADPQIKEGGWNGSPYSYLQYVLAQWAVKRLRR